MNSENPYTARLFTVSALVRPREAGDITPIEMRTMCPLLPSRTKKMLFLPMDTDNGVEKAKVGPGRGGQRGEGAGDGRHLRLGQQKKFLIKKF